MIARGALNLTPAERARVDDIDALVTDGAVAVDALVERLDDVSWAVRRTVTASLARLGNAAVAPLVELLLHRRDNEGRLAAAVDALVASRGDPEDALVRLASGNHPAPVLCDAAQVLGRRQSAGAVPALAALSAHADDNVALAALEALGRIGGDVAIDLLIAAVTSKNFFRSFPAIDLLGRSGSPRAVEPLVALLAERHYAVEAARALGRTGQQGATRALVALLARQNDAQARAAAVALAEIHEVQASRFGTAHAVETAIREGDVDAMGRRLVQTLTGADPGEQRAICRVLGWTGGDSAILGLIELLDAEPTAAAAAAASLAKLGAAAEPHLVDALHSSGSERRLLILPLLGARAKLVNDVLECLADPSPNVRALACDTLGRIGDPSVVAQLFPLLAEADARVSQGAASAIQSLGSAETERLALDAARSSDARVRRGALRIVSYFGYRAGLQVLVDAMGDADERIRDVAAVGLASIDAPSALPTLLSAAQHPSARTRAAAVRALGQANVTDATKGVLRAALADDDAWVRYYACQALGRIGDTDSETAIIARLEDPAGQVRVAAVDTLARLGGDLALDALHRAVRSKEQDVERAALLGLGLMKRTESLAVLKESSASADAATRLVALSALAEYATNDVLPLLGAAVADADESVRSAAVGLLSTRPGARATQVLIEQLGNRPMQDRVVRALAQPVLGRIEGTSSALRVASAESAPLLVAALARMRRSDADAAMLDALGDGNVFARRAVAAALAVLDTKEARAALEAASRADSDREVRHICLAALAP